MADIHSHQTPTTETHDDPKHRIMPGHGHNDDTTTLPIVNITVPFPVYTVVFMTLGVLTVIEVLAAEIITLEPLRVGLLVGLGVVKAALVVLFYMHLRHDSRFFAVALLLPTLVALLSGLYLLGVPPTGY